MNALTTPTKQHDYLHFECRYPRRPADDGSVDKHSLAILKEAFQSILDDADKLDSVLSWYRDRDDSKLGLHIKCAIHYAKKRYVRDHIDELEAEESSAPPPRAA